jgi:transposase
MNSLIIVKKNYLFLRLVVIYLIIFDTIQNLLAKITCIYSFTFWYNLSFIRKIGQYLPITSFQSNCSLKYLYLLSVSAFF